MISRRVQAIACALLATALAGCTATAYKANLPSPSAKAPGYPIPLYPPDMKVPRPCRVIGTISITGGKFTMFGGSSEAELAKLMQQARAKGADVIKIQDIDKPRFTNPNYTITADLLQYADQWETLGLDQDRFEAYLDSHRGQLDPIEGIWYARLPMAHAIGILRDNSRPGRQFIGITLHHSSAVWQPGMKKIDIRRGLEPGSYILTYYLDDFASREIPIILGQQNSFRFNLPRGEQDFFITYTKY